ncbi:hypothetical protein Slin_6601 [Spirosoma linguale DSM 74]|uniref:Lasso RiPP family leader peptide-containing protein n=1 Tax=Spirosoma linguale (strain ATCC 33905 / DSM 74 / LMG 10896 / Claus 1) TaxID=504472 RepID=D2QUS6_SPILD|nr:hypothetical protein Slin_6601 [Spirosoma linguale DSM 74]
MSKKAIHHISASVPKKAYKTPRIKSLGSVKQLTLKTGSAVDGFGTFG